MHGERVKFTLLINRYYTSDNKIRQPSIVVIGFIIQSCILISHNRKRD